MARPIVFLDLYCGAGGYSTGFVEAMHELGLPFLEVAINHWDRAIETMRTNHPDVMALRMDIAAATPDDIKADVIDLLHASPSCTHHSRAKGGKPRSNQLRSQPNEIWKFVDNKHVRRITIENVPEFIKWGPLTVDGRPDKRREGNCFNAWLQQFTARGYTYEWRILNCADYGDATSRKRFFLQAVKHGCGKIRWPEPTHAENPETDLWGHRPLRWRGIRECLDLSDLGTSIFNRKNPLSKNTLRRVAVGMKKYNGMGFLMDMLGIDGPDDSRLHSLDEPLPTQHSGGNRCAVVKPFVVRLNRHCDAEDIDAPLSTTTTKEHHAICQPLIIDHLRNGEAKPADKPLGSQHTHDRYSVVQPFIMDYFGLKHDHEHHVKSIDEPVPTLTTEMHHYLCQPLIIGQQSCAQARPIDDPCPTIATAGAISMATPIILDMSRPSENDSGHIGGADSPVRTITTFDNMQLAIPLIVDMSHPGDTNDAGRVSSGDEPLKTVTTSNNLAVVNLPRLPDGRLLDIRLRMLKPSELAAAHSFPADYKLAGNRADRIKQIGNSVPVQTAKAIVKAMFANLAA